MRAKLITVEFLTQESPSSSNIEDKSWLLNSFMQIPQNRALGFLASSMNKDKSLGRIFDDLESNSGKYSLEIGAILHDWLPNLSGHQDYFLSVPITDGEKIPLAVSNQMLRINYRKKGQFAHALVPQYLFKKLQSEDKLSLPDDYHVEVLKSVVTCRFEVDGNHAEDALELHIDLSIEKFIGAINRVISAQLFLSTDTTPVLTPTYDKGSFDYLYLIMKGRDSKKYKANRLSLSSFRTTLKPINYEDEKAKSFLGIIAGLQNRSEVIYLINSGKGYLEAGLIRFALLWLVIAAEIATTRFVHSMWQKAGVSKTKIKNSANDITYSQMLNIHIFALCSKELRPDKNLLSEIDKGRTSRNALMHEGKFELSQQDLRSLHGSTVCYVDFLNSVLKTNDLNMIT